MNMKGIGNFYRRWSGRKSDPLLLAERPELSDHDIGKWSYGKVSIPVWSKNSKLKIGKYCSFAEDSMIFLGGEHQFNNISMFPFGRFLGGASWDAHAATKGDVIIGNDVWVGRRALILSGVTIEDGAVIGAGAVVTKYVPAYAIVAGNPARAVKMRFEPEIVAELLRIKWWDWSDDKVRQNVKTLLSNDINALRRVYDATNQAN